MTKIFVGLSGGVDSSVTAALLKEQGYDVTGVYMKNWTKDMPGFPCPWKEDYQDAKRVAVQLGIPFRMYDFETQYKHIVVDYMIDEYKAGRTPNPDIVCNQEVKFKLFLNAALKDGADLIATGHYARTRKINNSQKPHLLKDSPLTTLTIAPLTIAQETRNKKQETRLMTAKNKDKDQTYFLYRVSEEALKKTLFPIGEFTDKKQVRELAKKFGLVTASKKDSQGICFVGQVGIKEFLGQYVKTRPGEIIDENNKPIGQHDGAIFYTIGQRHGLDVGGGLPYYVTGKDMKKNEVYVTTNLDDKNLWSKQIKLTNLHWINSSPLQGATLMVRTRHRAPLIKAVYKNSSLELEDEVRALTPGQSAVIYDGNLVLGGGIII